MDLNTPVSAALARLLKGKGFNEPCKVFYDNGDSKLERGDWELVTNNSDVIKAGYAIAPTYAQLIEWLEDCYDIIITLTTGNPYTTFEFYNVSMKYLERRNSFPTTMSTGSSDELEALTYILDCAIDKVPTRGLVNIIAEFTVHSSNLIECDKLFKQLARESRKEIGCLDYNVRSDEDGTFILIESFKDKYAQGFHRDTPHVKEILKGKIMPMVVKKKVKYLI